MGSIFNESKLFITWMKYNITQKLYLSLDILHEFHDFVFGGTFKICPHLLQDQIASLVDKNENQI